MACYGLYSVLIVLIIQTCVIYVQGQITKSSLTFVIDYTKSMKEEVNLLKEGIDKIFDKVCSSNTSQIENFVLVTFNDTGAEVRTVTKDRNEFKQALASIRLHSDYNYDCPKKAMTGIEAGLILSLPESLFYVFTDASANDYDKFEHVKTLMQKKRSQVVFLLTGDCGSTTNPEYQVYSKMAQATGGQIFRIMEDDVKDILKYIEESITGKRFPFHNQVYPPGTHKIKFNVDAHTGDVLISLTGLGSRIGEVTGPGGTKPPAESIVSGKNVTAVKRLSKLTPGDYELEIEGKGEVHIIVNAKSDINFQLGFSIDTPSSINDTVTRPPPDGHTFVGIRLVGEEVELTSVKIVDLDKNVIAEMPLTLVDKKEQFYVTPSFYTPSNIFLVNVIGKDSKTGTPVIRTNPSPISRQNPSADSSVPVTPTRTIHVKEGETVKVDCGIAISSEDNMRWYKDHLAIASGELTLYSVTRSDDGLYTCRVSNPTKSRSVTTKVVVGFKPQFSTTEPDIVEFVHGANSVILSCEAYGEPRPTTATWKHNGNTLTSTDMSYSLEMVYGATGTYECEISNAFGSIRRTFKVTSRDCILDTKKDFPKKQPIIYSHALRWPVFPVKEGYMIIPHEDYFYMNCPSRFSNATLPAYNLMAYCERDNTIKIEGNLYNFADLQCNKEVEPQVSKTGIPCLPGKTEYVKIGYQLETVSKFLEVFDVCLDTENNVPLFTKHTLSPYHTDRFTETAWSSSLLPQDFDTLYNCSRQMYDITSTLGRGLSTHDTCCFSKRQLVNSHNLLPGIPPSSAYSYLNVIPHWSTCNSKNWEDVEQSVRKLVKSAGRDLIITTGIASPGHSGASSDITLHDSRGGKQSVAPYLWKVVQDPFQSASLAIIQINIPELTAGEASKHVLCPNICGDGIKHTNWTKVEDGYTYCCSIMEFEKAFGYNGRFSSGMFYVLFDGSLMPSSYLS